LQASNQAPRAESGFVAEAQQIGFTFNEVLLAMHIHGSPGVIR
jgi:hypothetical protein